MQHAHAYKERERERGRERERERKRERKRSGAGALGLTRCWRTGSGCGVPLVAQRPATESARIRQSRPYYGLGFQVRVHCVHLNCVGGQDRDVVCRSWLGACLQKAIEDPTADPPELEPIYMLHVSECVPCLQ